MNPERREPEITKEEKPKGEVFEEKEQKEEIEEETVKKEAEETEALEKEAKTKEVRKEIKMDFEKQKQEKQKSSMPDFFKDIPDETTKFFKGDWSVPELDEEEKKLRSPEQLKNREIQFLLSKASGILLDENANPRITAETGRILLALKQEIEDMEEDAPLRQSLLSSANFLWFDGGGKEKYEWFKQLTKSDREKPTPEKAESEKPESKQEEAEPKQEEEKPKSKDEIEIEELARSYNENVAAYNQIKDNLPILIKRMQTKVSDLENIINKLEFKNDEDKKRIEERLSGLLLTRKMFERLKQNEVTLMPVPGLMKEVEGESDNDKKARELANYKKIQEFKANSEKILKGNKYFFEKNMLPAYDSIDGQINAIKNNEIDVETKKLFEGYGILKTYEEMNDVFMSFCKNIGTEKINVKEGETINYDEQEPFDTIKDTSNLHKDEEVQSIARSGFKYKGKVLRVAQVIVWKK